jgi:hypothetical protein
VAVPSVRSLCLVSLVLVAAGCATEAPGGSPVAKVRPGHSHVGSSALPVEPPAHTPAQIWRLLSTSAGTHSGARTLDEAVAHSEVVIAGRLVELAPGGGYDSGDSVGWYGLATFEVEMVLHGADVDTGDMVVVPFLVTMGVPGSVYPSSELAALRRSMPKDAALLFLVSWATFWDRTDTDVPDWLAGLDRPDLYRTIGAEGGLALVDGVVVDQGVSDAAYPAWARRLTGLSLTEIQRHIGAGDAT